MNNAIDIENQVFPVEEYPLPRRLSDFDDSLSARNYLIELPQRMALNCGENTDLRDMKAAVDNTALLSECFKKLAKLPLPKWIALREKYGEQKNRQD
ncbi:hypothetical protein OGM63_13540 [Plectonema radiosum NIES-515]|uniref:Uncharacterized protein n=1 Tax=Plectonema radiosum NIES-515 TaxID=2986073 RepID=A0ABT3AZG7_9CYAN|nr:hypothetical protein [Plectonema radiosum]MCV3214523.1 hypothetical protein [Plectonema radiosum NIES-515]